VTSSFDVPMMTFKPELLQKATGLAGDARFRRRRRRSASRRPQHLGVKAQNDKSL